MREPAMRKAQTGLASYSNLYDGLLSLSAIKLVCQSAGCTELFTLSATRLVK